MPVFRDRTSRTDFFALSNDDTIQFQFSGAMGKYTTAFPIDGVGDFKPPFVPPLLITTDNVPGDNTTTATINVTPVGGAITDNDIISTIDTLGDKDFYKVTLTAGTAYEFHLYSYGPPATTDVGPNAAGLTDPYLELYAPDGTTMLVSADGGADTVYNQANSGFDVLLVYTPTQSGTFYVNARAFSNSPATNDGDSVGDYLLAVREQDPNDPTVYHPYYEPDEPLYAIDWGTQVNKVNQTVRNPDGDEGTRDTGNAQGTPTYDDQLAYDPDDDGPLPIQNYDMAGLAAAQGKDITGKNVITIYFAKPGDVIEGGLPPATVTAVAPQDFERLAVFTSLGEFEKVADVIYLEVDDIDDADFVYTSYQGTPGPGVSLLGSMSPPDEPNEGVAQFNSGDSRWNAVDLQQGGFSFVTLIHEFGHGHGLAHPHDNGGHSGIMNGVEEESPFNYTTGDYDLNQGVFTMMSYEDGWQTSPHTPTNAPTTGGYGYLGGLMAFDIAAIQDKYGVNEDWATGNDTYTMKDVNAPGTYYYSIWDGGGIDAIVYGGARNSTIDLRAATLQYEYGGGGNVSFALGIYGGFTIANGVTIENATTGSGNDTLIGNAVANVLNGGAGADSLTGLAGDDIYYVDNVGDLVSEATSQGRDVVYSSISYALAAGSSVEVLSTTAIGGTDAIDLTGNEIGNVIYGNYGANAINGGGGVDYMVGFGGDDIYYVDNAADYVSEDADQGRDVVYTGSNYVLTAGSAVEVLSASALGDTTALSLTGNALGNVLTGNAGANSLNGAGGADYMAGLFGDDVYYVDNAGDVASEEAGQGRDAVYASTSYVLTAHSSVEVMSTTALGDTTAIDLTGNALGNALYGNAGANVLNGAAGGDLLVGFGGADTFAFTTGLGGDNVDWIYDFQTGTDRIALDDAAFVGLGLGTLSAGAFRAGTTAQDADDRILYDSSTGNLYFDADGVGGAAAVQFATLGGGTSLAASDFIVI